ncbi:MAG TPA: thioesterase family protein [Ignavibacteriaceae bacterium]|nr:thioesterase family protein [Ignavibacteriaceae bacterium]
MEIEKFKHKISIKVRFSDLDAMGHVNNATYLSYLEEARIAYYNDVMKKDSDSLDFNAVVARIEIDYVSQIRLGDKVEIYNRTSKIGNKSSDLEHIIAVKKNNERIVAAKAVTKLVSFDYKKNQSVPVSEKAREIIEEFEGGN